MESRKIIYRGGADLREFSTPENEDGEGYPFAISWIVPMDPRVMISIKNGPNQAYADEYSRVNNQIDELAAKLTFEIKNRGFRAMPLAASKRIDMENIKGLFPHKTAATRAGLGWIGRNCQLVTREFGSWVRLGTLFTDMHIPCGDPVEHSLCKRCKVCVRECPADALSGKEWYPGISREEILDAAACDKWKKEKFYRYHKGRTCGICSAVCPIGLKSIKRNTDKL